MFDRINQCLLDAAHCLVLGEQPKAEKLLYTAKKLVQKLKELQTEPPEPQAPVPPKPPENPGQNLPELENFFLNVESLDLGAVTWDEERPLVIHCNQAEQPVSTRLGLLVGYNVIASQRLLILPPNYEIREGTYTSLDKRSDNGEAS